MASKLTISLLLLLHLSTLSPIANGFQVDEIATALYSKGYAAMAVTLEQSLSSLVPPQIPQNNKFTIFCPPDRAFFSLRPLQPPLSLLQYHIAPLRLDRQSLESSFQFESKLDTLLLGHPLVVTTIPKTQRASINDVKIRDWAIYDDGGVIVHGIEDFFDPAVQILRYPWFDGWEGRIERKKRTGRTWVDLKYTLEGMLLTLAVSAMVYMIYDVCFYRIGPVCYGHLSPESDIAA
ncbi:hypothetical protein NMG60_11013054 [Bertholletia excelsa]